MQSIVWEDDTAHCRCHRVLLYMTHGCNDQWHHGHQKYTGFLVLKLLGGSIKPMQIYVKWLPVQFHITIKIGNLP